MISIFFLFIYVDISYQFYDYQKKLKILMFGGSIIVVNKIGFKLKTTKSL